MRNQKGFTLIEIIAVLLILGILAAVAVPRFIDLASEAKIRAAESQVAEMKATLNLAWGKEMLAKGSVANADAVVTAAGFTSGTAKNIGTAPDIWSVNLTAAAKAVTIAVINRDGDIGYNATGTWNIPQ